MKWGKALAVVVFVLVVCSLFYVLKTAKDLYDEEKSAADIMSAIRTQVQDQNSENIAQLLRENKKSKNRLALQNETRTWSQIHRQYKNAIGMIQLHTKAKYKKDTVDIFAKYGTAFFVSASEPKILTACHNLELEEDTVEYTNASLSKFIDLPVGEIYYVFVDCNGNEYPATLNVSTDTSDLAELTVENIKSWPHLKLESKNSTLPGDEVCLIGYPFEEFNSITAGIISNVHITCEDYGGYQDLIQMDCPANEGSSGGPLFNRKGEVIGVAVMIAPRKQSVSYCVPIHFYTEGTANWETPEEEADE